MRLPQIIGPWRLIQRLGHGAFGSVYLAEIAGDAGFTSRVAVKILDAGAIDRNPTIGQSLIDEAKLLSHLKHPNIVQVLQLQKISHDFLGETYAMAMEFVDGITLATLMENVGLAAAALNIEATVAVLAEVAAALEYAHDHPGEHGEPLLIVHRDLKPANLIVTPEGNIKVLDFGIAWAAERGVEATREGMTKGTLPYMSPEQVHGMHVDARSDLFSLGTILFEMVVGEPFVGFYPFGQSDVARMVKRVAELQYDQRQELLIDSLTKHPHHLDGLQAQAVEGLLARLLARNPDDRFQSAAELREEVESLYVFWRPEVGRRELSGRVTEWFKGNPRPGAESTQPFMVEPMELTLDPTSGNIAAAPPGDAEAADKRSPSGTETWLLPEDRVQQSGDQPMPSEGASQGQESEEAAPTGVLPSSDHDLGGETRGPTAAASDSLPSSDAAPLAPPGSHGRGRQSETTAVVHASDSVGHPAAAQGRPEAPAVENSSTTTSEGGPASEGTHPPKDATARPRRRRAAGKRAAARAPDSKNVVLALVAMALLGGLLLLIGIIRNSTTQRDTPADTASSQADLPNSSTAKGESPDDGKHTGARATRISDVRIEGNGDKKEPRTTVSFIDSKGAIVLAPVLPGRRSEDGLGVSRNAEGWLNWAVVGTRAMGSSKGVLVLWDLRGAEPAVVWRLDNFFEESPEVDIGVHGATTYGFAGVDFYPSGDEVPEVLAVAHDRNFAPTWLLRLDSLGQVIGQRYHPGHLRTVFAVDRDRVVTAGVSNRLCPGGTAPCGQEEVLWVVPPPVASEYTEFLPGCGGSPVPTNARGYSWPKADYRIDSVLPNDTESGGFELVLERRSKRPDSCPARLSFDNEGRFQGQFSECGFEAPVTPVSAEAGSICSAWAAIATP